MIALITRDPSINKVVGYPAHRPDSQFTANQMVVRSFVTDDGIKHSVSLEEDGFIGQLESEMIKLPNMGPIYQDDAGMWHDGRQYIDTADVVVINRKGVFAK